MSITLSKMDHKKITQAYLCPARTMVGFMSLLLGSKTCPTKIIPSFWLGKSWNPTKYALWKLKIWLMVWKYIYSSTGLSVE
jgi:hypothetical protein